MTFRSTKEPYRFVKAEKGTGGGCKAPYDVAVSYGYVQTYIPVVIRKPPVADMIGISMNHDILVIVLWYQPRIPVLDYGR